eukprot:s1277_g12.t1
MCLASAGWSVPGERFSRCTANYGCGRGPVFEKRMLLGTIPVRSKDFRPQSLMTAAACAWRVDALRYAPSGDSFYPVELNGAIFDSFNLRVVFERDKTGFEESKEFPIRTNTVVAARYQIIEYLGSAAFSRAVQCLDLDTNKMVCMKIIKNDKDFFDQSLDEIKLLKYINVNGNEHLIIVTELLRDNLYEFSKYNRECGTLDAEREILPDKAAVRRGNVFDNKRTV